MLFEAIGNWMKNTTDRDIPGPVQHLERVQAMHSISTIVANRLDAQGSLHDAH
jgi:hypothetical protein